MADYISKENLGQMYTWGYRAGVYDNKPKQLSGLYYTKTEIKEYAKGRIKGTEQRVTNMITGDMLFK